MNLQRKLIIGGASVGMLILILDGKTALAGAREGIELCLMTLIPSLFPFFVVSILLTVALAGSKLPFLRPVGKLCSIPEGSEFLLSIGFLGGYPVGAQNVALACRSGHLSRQDAQRMIGFCSNAGPAFLFGIIAPMFSKMRTAWVLWAIHILSALLVAVVIPASPSGRSVRKKTETITLTQALEKSVHNMALVCGWVILFRMVLTLLDRWLFWALQSDTVVILSGLLELSNGCVQLGNISCEGLRFLAAGVMLALGGVCVTMQTASVCSGLSLRFYFPGKLLQCCFTILLCFLAQGIFPAADRWDYPMPLLLFAGLGVLLLAFFLRKTENSCSIPAAHGV